MFSSGARSCFGFSGNRFQSCKNNCLSVSFQKYRVNWENFSSWLTRNKRHEKFPSSMPHTPVFPRSRFPPTNRKAKQDNCSRRQSANPLAMLCTTSVACLKILSPWKKVNSLAGCCYLGGSIWQKRLNIAMSHSWGRITPQAACSKLELFQMKAEFFRCPRMALLSSVPDNRRYVSIT